MNIFVNGENSSTDCATLSLLVEELGHNSETIATAVEGEFVSIVDRETTLLTESLRIEIVSPMQGG